MEDKKIEVSEIEKIERWDEIHTKIGTREDVKLQYDGWLESDNILKEIVQDCKTPIIDLGCGSGNNTLHLIEIGKEVIACDFSNVAIKKIKDNIPEAKIEQFNLKEKMPFPNDYTELIIADLSLHYFSKKETEMIIQELYRILKPNGSLIFRVNSINDKNFGAGQGEKIEENFYIVRGTTKRFFDKESILEFFKNWNVLYIKESEMDENNIRTLWQGKIKQNAKKKISWTVAVQKRCL